jgi:hypothetical protein
MSVTISTVNVGTTANDGSGDDIRDAFIKVNYSLSNLKTGIDTVSSGGANTTLAKVANLQVTNRVIGNVYLYGSDTIYINGTPVTTAGNAFTGGNVAGISAFQNATGSNSAAYGAVTITGGLGVGQNIYAAGIGVYNGNLVVASVTDAGSLTAASLITKGGLAVVKSARIGTTLLVSGATTLSSTLAVTGATTISSTTTSTNTTTGALQVGGGAGIVGNINAGGTQHTLSGNLIVTGNLEVNGNLSFGTDTFRISDNMIDLHTNSDLSPLTIDDGKDVGIKFHVYKTGYADYHAFAGWANDSTAFEYYDRGIEIAGVFTGNSYGVFKGGEFLSVNTTAATSTTTGAIRTSGGVGVAGNIYAGGNLVVTANVSAGNVSATKGTFSTGAFTSLTAAGATTLANVTAGGIVSNGTVRAATINAAVIGNTSAVLTGTLSTAAQTNITSLGTLTSLAVGAVTSSGTVIASTVNAGTIGNSGATLTGTLSTAAQTNITSVGTLSTVTVTGATTSGNIITTNGVFWSNGTAFASSLYSNTNVAAYLTGTVTVGNLITTNGVFWSNGATALGGAGGGYGNIQVAQYLPVYSGSLGGTLVTAAQTNITSVGTLTSLAVTGNVSAGNVSGTKGTFTSVAGTILTAAQTNITSVGALTSLAVGAVTSSGTIIASTVNAGTIGNASAVFSGASATLTGTLIATTVNAGTIGNASATLTGTLSTAAQNSVTTMTGLTGFGTAGVVTTAAGHLTVTGNLTVNGTQNIINNTTYETTEFVVTQNATYGNISNSLYAGSINTANAVITGGSINNVTVGATTHATGRFTTVTATTVNAGTIGNASATLTGTLSTAAQTNITSVGTLTGLTVSGNILPSANLTYNLGSTTAWFNNIYGVSVQAKYADLAENYISDTLYRPGTVVVFGGSAEITLATEFADVSVAGVISTDPAYLMNAANPGQPVALRGRVPVDVIGPVQKGDLLVTSDCPGYAASVGKNANYGVAVFAKALQDKDDDGVGTIEAVII